MAARFLVLATRKIEFPVIEMRRTRGTALAGVVKAVYSWVLDQFNLR